MSFTKGDSSSNMVRHFISPQARSLSLTFVDVCTKLKEKIINNDNETRVVLDEAHPSVRGNNDPTMRTPMIDMVLIDNRSPAETNEKGKLEKFVLSPTLFILAHQKMLMRLKSYRGPSR
ncbi:unnamed protein product [Caenorhabditis auriculariae]|uniref:Uncharacterized protein n=1 Tax=Caenorhabditis auriculariae TaxID=2777116 RepID=A0A8S1GZI8_9PELO|nr:unnamed protein product [Caenorhabditis auriculariae]